MDITRHKCEGRANDQTGSWPWVLIDWHWLFLIFIQPYIAIFCLTTSQSSLGPIMLTDCRARSASVRWRANQSPTTQPGKETSSGRFLWRKSVMFWLRLGGYVLWLFTLTLLAWQVPRDGTRYFGLSSCGLPLGLSSARVSGFMFVLVIEWGVVQEWHLWVDIG